MNDLLSRDQINDLHLATLELFENTGVCLQHEKILDMLYHLGAKVDYKKMIVKIPEYLLKETLMNTPRYFQLVGRDNKNKVNMGDNNTYFSTQNAAFVEDATTGNFIEPTKKDAANLIRLADALENISMINTPGVRDVPESVMDIHEFETLINNTTKPFQLISFRGAQSVRSFIEMASIVLGSREELMRKPLFTVGPGGTSPLLRTRTQLEALIETANNKIPASYSGQPVAAGTSPVSMAGNIVVGNAEVLSGIIVSQFIKKGSPVYYLGISYPMDMRTGITATGSPERSLFNQIIPQLARFYGIPCAVIANTDSHTYDAQSGFEKALGILTAFQGKANLVWGIGGMGASVSLTQAVIDNEIVDMVKRIMSGMDISTKTIALDIIEKVGPGGNFLSEKHTSEYFKKEIIHPRISNRLTRGAWERSDLKEISSRAKMLVKKILNTHEPKPLEISLQKELRKYIVKKEKTIP